MTIDRRILMLLAEELDSARHEIEALGLALCSDAAIAARHVGDLQRLDHIGQRQMEVAEILRAPDMAAAAAKTRLEAMHGRLNADDEGFISIV